MATRKKTAPGEKPSLGLPDPLEAAREAAHNFAEGNRKLSLAVDALRTGLELVANAEWDHDQGRPVSPQELRAMAVAALNAYSQVSGQNWRRHPIIGNRAGDTNLTNLEA